MLTTAWPWLVTRVTFSRHSSVTNSFLSGKIQMAQSEVCSEVRGVRCDLTIPRAESDLAESGVVQPRELHHQPDEAALAVILHNCWIFLLAASSFTFSADTAGLGLSQQTSCTPVLRVLRGVIALPGEGRGGGYSLNLTLLPHLHFDRLDAGSRSIPCPRAASPQKPKRRRAKMSLLLCRGGEAGEAMIIIMMLSSRVSRRSEW